MSDLLTPAARAIVKRLEDSERDMHRRFDEADVPSYLRSIFEAKRDTYRMVLAWLPHELRDVEDQAIEVELSVAGYALRYARLAAGLPPTELPWEDPNVPLALSLFPAEEADPTDDAA